MLLITVYSLSVSFSLRLTAHVPHAAPTVSRPAERPSPNASERPGLLPPRLSGRPAGTSDTMSAPLNGPTGSLPGMSSAPDEARTTAAPAGALRIILISRAPSNRRLLAYYLDELPHEVREARSADEAQAIYEIGRASCRDRVF